MPSEAKPVSQLAYLRSKSIVDCDTLDASVPQELGPFVDCTSNQAIAYGEISKKENSSLVGEAASLANELHKSGDDISLVELAVEIMMVKLSVRIAPHISGCVHTQTNPKYSFSKDQTIANGRRIVQLYSRLMPELPKDRICIKIPSTWEGLQACKVLESEGIYTLATTLFCIEQAALAAEVGCRYIAPYVNVLKVHFEPGFVDENKAFGLCVEAQRYFKKHGYKTQCLPASLTSTAEVLQLAGVDHITVSPPLLRGLAEAEYTDATIKSLFEAPAADFVEVPEKLENIHDESDFRLATNRSADGTNAGKLVQAINIFYDMQEKMEKVALSVLEKLPSA